MNDLTHLSRLAHVSPAIGTFSENSVEFTLVDSSANVQLPGFNKSSTDFAHPKDFEWWMKLETLHGGKQEGTQLVVMDNGRLQFGVSPTRGMGLTHLVVTGNDPYPIGWKSPIQEVVHPQFVDLASRGGIGWLDGFSEWVCRCGLEFAGEPGSDMVPTDEGGISQVACTLHGRISNTPASHVVFRVDEAPPHRLYLRGTVCEYSYHGAKLRLETEIATEPGSLWVEVTDVVTNVGGRPQEFQLIYHSNYGDPILEQGARVVGAFKQVQPWSDHAAKFVDRWDTYEAPSARFVEQVYLGEMAGDALGATAILLHNADGSRGTSIRWNIQQLPYVSIWKNTVACADGYVTGLEPGTGFPNNRQVERQFGRVPMLEAGQSRTFSLRYEVHPDANSVATMQDSIAEIQAGTQRTVIPTSLRSMLRG